ncbi:MAG: xanthine dehydrogenase family protein molybdopterin-binding subunit [Gammaproteobacteria bacterium]|nr:xanthine dehydrogenase family protein molybdopterin-binding subunit [Gammaproteobacteria bacterium]
MRSCKLTRRDFIKVSTLAGGGLLMGFPFTGLTKAQSDKADTAFQPNAWISIGTDDKVTLQVASAEMGQGILTGIAMILAEELDADWSRVKAEFAPADKAYYNPMFGRQATGGSTAVRAFWNPLRKAGAAAREMLLQAAADRWQVDPSDCRTEKSKVIHDDSGNQLAYGELVRAAATLPVPETVFLKEPDEFVLLGKPLPRLDTPLKVDGSAVFGMDVQLEGLLSASVARSPTIGGKVKSFDAKPVLAMPGVKAVKQISSGVAVIAEHYWAAKQGRDALQIEWDEGLNKGLDSARITAEFAKAIDSDGVVERDAGDIETALQGAAKTLEAVYTVPFQAHACMEPMNATADVRSGSCDLYLPTQNQTRSQAAAIQLTGLPEEKVKVHTTYLGGGFGRRGDDDFVKDAVECSMAVAKPVKVIWSREDDILYDKFRPATYNRLRGGVDADGRIVAWEHRIAGASIMGQKQRGLVPGKSDWSNTEGAKNIPYAIPNLQVRFAMYNPGIPVGFWRSVGSSQNAYITECFFDELASLAGQDPLQARLELMEGHPRHAGVLKLAAEKAGFGKKLTQGHAQGIAVAESFGSFVAQVAEVSIQRGRVRVHRVTCAVDCGMIVNPDTIHAQMESAIAFGLTSTLKSEITIKDGRTVQSNFDDFPLLHIDEMPEVDVHIMQSDEAPGGIGEPGVPPIAPAVANAVFALTGKPIRSIPIRHAG